MPSPKSANLRHLDYEWITGNPEVEPRQQFLAARRLPHLRRLAPTRASEVLLILAKHTRISWLIFMLGGAPTAYEF